MIIGTAVAEAELKHQSGHMFYQLSRTIEASALRLYATDKAVKAAHGQPMVFELA